MKRDAALEFRQIAESARTVSSNPGAALTLLQRTGERLATDSRRKGEVFSVREFDHLCVEIGKTVRETERAETSCRRPVKIRLFYVTTLLPAGGHTRIVEDIVDGLSDDEHHILYVRAPQSAPHDVVRTRRRVHFHQLSGSPLERLKQAFNHIDRLRPDSVIHLADPDDAVGTAMLVPDVSERSIMIHHNDHSFAFGRYVEGVRHVAPHSRLKTILDQMLGEDVVVLPLTTKLVPDVIEWDDEPYPLLTLTSGTSNKFQDRKEHRYSELLEVRFACREGLHVHIGDLPKEKKATARRVAARFGDAERFIHIPFVPSLTDAMSIIRPDLYLNSYPVGGGRALVEAMAIGLPIASASYAPALDSAFMIYDGGLTWRTLPELRAQLQSFDSSLRARHHALSRAHYERCHSNSRFEKALTAIFGSQPSGKDRL